MNQSSGLRDADNLTPTPVGCTSAFEELSFKMDQLLLDIGTIRGYIYTIKENTVRCG